MEDTTQTETHKTITTTRVRASSSEPSETRRTTTKTTVRESSDPAETETQKTITTLTPSSEPADNENHKTITTTKVMPSSDPETQKTITTHKTRVTPYRERPSNTGSKLVMYEFYTLQSCCFCFTLQAGVVFSVAVLFVLNFTIIYNNWYDLFMVGSLMSFLLPFVIVILHVVLVFTSIGFAFYGCYSEKPLCMKIAFVFMILALIVYIIAAVLFFLPVKSNSERSIKIDKKEYYKNVCIRNRCPDMLWLVGVGVLSETKKGPGTRPQPEPYSPRTIERWGRNRVCGIPGQVPGGYYVTGAPGQKRGDADVGGKSRSLSQRFEIDSKSIPLERVISQPEYVMPEDEWHDGTNETANRTGLARGMNGQRGASRERWSLLSIVYTILYSLLLLYIAIIYLAFANEMKHYYYMSSYDAVRTSDTSQMSTKSIIHHSHHPKKEETRMSKVVTKTIITETKYIPIETN